MGVLRNISDTKKVPSSLNAPSSKTSRNSVPSSKAWIECGTPAGKNHTSPAHTSSTKVSPPVPTVDTRTQPLSISDHSLAVCQCSSRYALGPRRMSTPAMASALGSTS